MKRWGAMALAALAALCLTGCGKAAVDSREEPEPSGLYQQSSGIAPDAVLLTAAGREIPAWRYFYWLTYDCDYLRETCDAEGRVLDWDSRREDGRTLAQYVKDQARDTAVLYAVVESWAERYGCGLTAEDDAAMEREWQDLCARYGGESRCLAELRWMGLTRQEADAFTADYYRYDRLQALVRTPGSALAPAEEALTAYAVEHGYITADILRISTRNADEASLAEKRERAELARRKLAESADPAAGFQALAETCGDPGESLYGVTFAPGDGRVDEAVERAAQPLGENQWSEVLEVPGGLAVVLRLPLDRSAVAADWLDDALQQAADEAEIIAAREYEAVDPADFYEKLTAARAFLDRSGGLESS